MFKCSICGETHPEMPLDLAVPHPADYYKIPESQRKQRIFQNSDLCIIYAGSETEDDEVYVRGVLPLPIQGTDQEFRFGLWARIDEEGWNTYAAVYQERRFTSVDQIEAFPGALSGGIVFYPDSDMVTVALVIEDLKLRPVFYVVGDHPLKHDQQSGITWETAHSFVEHLSTGQNLDGRGIKAPLGQHSDQMTQS